MRPRSAAVQFSNAIDFGRPSYHIGVPDDRKVMSVERHTASSGGRRLSDHDAYVVEIEDPPKPTAASSGRRDGKPASLEARG